MVRGHLRCGVRWLVTALALSMGCTSAGYGQSVSGGSVPAPSWTYGDLATAIVALVAIAAFIRPDIEGWRRRRRAMVDTYLAGPVEVGFSNFGPTIGLQGTLRAINNDQFIRSAKVSIERVSDHMRHEFEWAVFRPQVFPATQHQQTFEIAAGFLLSEATPRQFNIQFHDRGTAHLCLPAFTNLQLLWRRYLQSKGIAPATLTPADMQVHYDEFHQIRLGEITPLFQIVDRLFYWVGGEYRLTMELAGSRPDRNFSYDCRFRISEEESQLLRLNVIACQLVVCSIPNVTFNFVYPQQAST